MNTFLLRNHQPFTFPVKLFMALFFCITVVQNANAAAGFMKYETNPKDSIVVTTILNMKNHKARLYPDTNSKNLLFAARGKKGKAYQLFVFDMDGKLVTQTRILEKQTELLTSIKKGNYLFEVFNDDLRIENGSIVIK